MILKFIAFLNPIALPNGTVIEHWRIDQKIRDVHSTEVHAERTPEGALLRPMKQIDGELRPTGDVVFVNLTNITSMIWREDEKTSGAEVQARAQGRTRLPQEMANAK